MTSPPEPDPARLHAALQRIFGPEVAVAVRSIRGSPTRALEFEAGRRCASEVLHQLGAGVAMLDSEPDGAPRWPSGLVGSISHSGGWVVAVAASLEHATGIGVDCQRYRPLPAERLTPCFVPEEMAWLESSKALRSRRATALFGMKESVQKCVRSAYGFLPPPHTLIVTPDEAAHRFSAAWAEGGAAESARSLPRGAFAELDGVQLAGAWLNASPARYPCAGIP